MALNTELTRRLQISHPIISAPMAFAEGGKLAAAVTEAGGLGFIGEGMATRRGWQISFAPPAAQLWAAGSSRGRSLKGLSF